MSLEINTHIINLLNKSGISVTSLDSLDGYILERDVLLKDGKLEHMVDEIKQIKKIFTASTINALQKNAKERQKWPLLNLIRQTLKNIRYNMVPFRKANGYDKNRKKIFVRYFKIEKIKEKKNDEKNDENNDENNDNEILSKEDK